MRIEPGNNVRIKPGIIAVRYSDAHQPLTSSPGSISTACGGRESMDYPRPAATEGSPNQQWSTATRPTGLVSGSFGGYPSIFAMTVGLLEPPTALRSPEHQQVLTASMEGPETPRHPLPESTGKRSPYRLPSTCSTRCTLRNDGPVIGCLRLFHTARAVFDRALVVQLRAEGDHPVESGPQPSGCCRKLCQKVPKPVLNNVPRSRRGLDLTALR